MAYIDLLEELPKGVPRIMKRTVSCLAKLLILTGLLSVPLLAQDFQGTYELGPDGRISIANVSGDITVTGHSDNVVTVSAYFEGPDRELVRVEDLSGENSVVLQARYPQQTSCNASIQFRIQVPNSLFLRFDSLKTASGNVEISDVTGDVDAKSASGNMTVQRVDGYVDVSTASGDVVAVDIVGTVNAKTASGDVEVEITQLEGEGNLSFSSASGDVLVWAPASLNADVRMSTVSGKLETDFKGRLTVEDDEGPGKKAYGRLGSGLRELKISSASGNVSLLHSR
jgi:DUF4097 and DUF4098 domain-containing protein YvlB